MALDLKRKRDIRSDVAIVSAFLLEPGSLLI